MTIKRVVESSYFQNFIIALIILNGITLGLETYKNIYLKYEKLFYIFNFFVLTVFTIEIILRIIVYKKKFFKDGWSLFDFFVVLISLIPTGNGLEILRVLRVFRILRIITVIPKMRKIVSALFSVIPSIISIAGLLFIIFYVSSVIVTQLYGETFPEWFGSLERSLYTLFQIMTLESWSMGIVRPVMEQHPYAWIFFIPFIFIVTFIMINLIIAIVVDAMNEITKKDTEIITNEIHEKDIKLLSEIESLKKEIISLKKIIENKK